MTTKGEPGTIKIPTADSEVIINALDVILIQRNGMNTTFNIHESDNVISTKEFEHYLKLTEKFSFLLQVNEDAIVNMYRVKAFKDHDGNIYKPGDPNLPRS